MDKRLMERKKHLAHQVAKCGVCSFLASLQETEADFTGEENFCEI